MFTILGSGFGSYGYLPALLEEGFDVAMPVRYRSAVAGRPELTGYLQQVLWCSDVDDALARSSGVVIALRPEDQALWVGRLLELPNIRQLILEKPVAVTPESSAALLTAIEAAGKRYRVGYTFRFTPWADRLRSVPAGSVDRVSLEWHFMAHHYRADLANWKRFTSNGGGAVRFYGIHAIALLSELGYDDVVTSTISGASSDEAERWEATFTGHGVCPCVLRIGTREPKTSFRITAHADGQEARTIADQLDPFSAAHSDAVHSLDARVGVLRQLCTSFSEADEGHSERQQAIVALWAAVEAKSSCGPSVT